MADIVQYLVDKGLEVKTANNNNIHVACFFCGEDPSSRGRLYVNVSPDSEPYGLFFCHLCGTKGTFNTILKHFGDAPIKHASDVAEDDTLPDDEFCAILASATDFYHKALMEYEPAYTYLTVDRGLSEQTLKKFKLGWAAGGLITHLVQEGFAVEDIQATGLVNKFGTDFLKNKITIPYHVSGQAVCIRGREFGKESGSKYLTPPHQKARLFNVDAITRAAQTELETKTQTKETVVKSKPVIAASIPDIIEGFQPEVLPLTAYPLVPPPRNAKVSENAVVITEGEIDCMTLDQLGFTCVAVPGINTWQDSWTDYLSETRRIFICFDNDEHGPSAAEKLATKLGPKSRIVEMPKARPGQKKIDVNSWVVNHSKNADDFRDLFSKAKGGLLVSVYESYLQWSELEGNANLEGLRFNIQQLDAAMRHGLLPAQVIVLLAKTGAGKTMAMINLFHRMSMIKDDIKILFVSLEQTRNEWFERAHRIFTLYNPEAQLEDTIEYWSDKLMIIDKNKITQDQLQSCIDQFRYEMGEQPHLVGVDYLGYYARSYKGEEYTRVTDAIMGLKEVAKDEGLVVITPSQSNRVGQFGKKLSLDNSKSSGAIEETASMVINIVNPDQDKPIPEQSREIEWHVLKTRDGGLGAMAKIQFAPLTLALVPQVDDRDPHAGLYYARALQEKHYAEMGESYERAVYYHRTGDHNIYTQKRNDV